MINFKVYSYLNKVKLYPFNNINVFFLYVLLPLLITYPLILQLNTSIYGIGHDNLGWLTSNFLQLKIWSENLDPEHVNYLAFPHGINQTKNIYMYTHEILNTSLLAITRHPIISYNIYFIIKLILASFCMYQLSYYLSKNSALSFIIGICYAYSPYFLNMSKAYGGSFITFSLPIVLLYIFKSIERTNLRNLIFFFISFLTLLGENYYYGYFFTVALIITTPILIIITLIIDKDIVLRKLRILINLLKINTIWFTIISVALLLFISILLKHVYPYFTDRAFLLHQAKFYSTDWKYYFLPSATNSLKDTQLFSIHQSVMDYLFPNYESIYSIHELFERTNFIGYFPVLLIILTTSLLLFRKNFYLLGIYKYKLIFFSLMFLISFILSFGPDYFLSTPFFKIAPMFRFQSRYFVIALISWFALLAIFLNLLFFHIKRKHRNLFSVTLIFLFYIDFAELNAGNIYNIYNKMPQAYKYLEKDKEPYAIITANSMISLPFQTNILGFQPFHEKKMVMKPQLQSPNIFIPEVQLLYSKLGVKYVIIITKFDNIKTPPLQVPHDANYLNNFFPHKDIFYLRLHKRFNDSLIYKFSDKLSFNNYEFNYKGRKYLFVAGNYRFEEAKAVCNYFNLHLVIINDLDENMFINHITPFYPIWLGGEIKTLNKWKWINGTNINFFNWAINEPSNSDNIEDRLSMKSDGKWYDLNRNMMLNIVCEE